MSLLLAASLFVPSPLAPLAEFHDAAVATSAQANRQAADRFAILLTRIVAARDRRDWTTMRAALPSVAWSPRPRIDRNQALSQTLEGTITIGSIPLNVSLTGTADDVRHVSIATDIADEAPAIAWPRVREALRHAGATFDELGVRCSAGADQRSVEISVGDHTAELAYTHEIIGQGPNAGQATTEYAFDFGSGFSENISGPEFDAGCPER